jgi:hypothetical protein
VCVPRSSENYRNRVYRHGTFSGIANSRLLHLAGTVTFTAMKTYEAPTLRVDGALSSHTLALHVGVETDISLSALGGHANVTVEGPDIIGDPGFTLNLPNNGSLLHLHIS